MHMTSHLYNGAKQVTALSSGTLKAFSHTLNSLTGRSTHVYFHDLKNSVNIPSEPAALLNVSFSKFFDLSCCVLQSTLLENLCLLSKPDRTQLLSLSHIEQTFKLLFQSLVCLTPPAIILPTTSLMHT